MSQEQQTTPDQQNVKENMVGFNIEDGLTKPEDLDHPHHQSVKRRNDFFKKFYVYLSIGSGMAFGTQLFFYEAVIISQIGKGHVDFALFCPQFIGFFLAGFLYHAKEMIHSKQTYGVFWNKEHSSYLIFPNAESPGLLDTQPTGPVSTGITLNKFNIWAVCLRTFVQVITVVLKIMVMKTAAAAHINFSLVANIYSITPFWVALAFYFIFKERITKIHLLGIVLITICILMTGLSSATSHSSSSGETSLHAIVPLIMALIYTIALTTISWTTRYVVKNSKMSVQQLMADSYILNGIIFLIILFVLGFNYPKHIIWEVGLISCLYVVGQYLLNEAVGHGKAASAQALHEIQSLWALFLEIVFLGKVPNHIQLIAFAIGFAGGVVLALESRRDGGH